MFDAMDFEYAPVPIEDARKPILPNTELLERTTRQRFEVLTRLPPRVVDDFVEL